MRVPTLTLVHKDFPPQSSPRSVRVLDPAETRSLIDTLVLRSASDETADTVADVLVRWSLEGRWLVCDCLGHPDQGAPVLGPRISVDDHGRGNDACTLVRLPGRPAHDGECAFGSTRNASPAPLHADRAPRSAPDALGVLGAAGGLRAVSASGGTTGLVRHESRSTRVPSLARVLFSLLEAARLNRRPSWCFGAAEERKRLAETIARSDRPFYMLERARVPAAEWVRTSLDDLATLGQLLVQEQTRKRWPSRSRPHGLIIDLIEHYVDEGQAVVFAPMRGQRVRVRGRVRIPGPGTKGPYVAIMLVTLPPGASEAEISQAYLHPAYKSGTFLLVDSDFERTTLDSLVALRKAVQVTTGTKLTIKKPLLDHPAPQVRPDFIVECGERKVVVETMGYTDDEYLGRKSIVHATMARVGPVVEDWNGRTDIGRKVSEAFGWKWPLVRQHRKGSAEG